MSNGGCEHHCTNNNGSFFCTCNAGFTLNKDHLSCIGMYVIVTMNVVVWLVVLDIDECETKNGGCTQTCNNTIGSYRCFCWDGYELANDSHTCDGKREIILVSTLTLFS